MAQATNSLDLLFPPFAEIVAKFDAKARSYGFFVYETFRSVDQQLEIWKKGRELQNGVWVIVDANQVATKARPGSSLHQYGLAIDYLPDGDLTKQGVQWSWADTMKNPSGKIIPVPWAAVGNISVSTGLEWGGNWKAIKDLPHHQLSYGFTAAQLFQIIMAEGLEGVWRKLLTKVPKKVNQIAVPVSIAAKPVSIPVVAAEDFDAHTEPASSKFAAVFNWFSNYSIKG